MVNQRNRIRSITLLIGDLVATLLAFLCAYIFREAFQEVYQVVLFPLSWYLNLLWLILPFWVFVFYLLGLYQFWRGPGFWKEDWMVFKAIFISSFLLGFGVFALKFQFVSRIFILSFSFFDLLLILLLRWVCRKLIRYLSHYSESYQNILMVGMDEHALKLAHGIEQHRDLGLRVMGFLSTSGMKSIMRAAIADVIPIERRGSAYGIFNTVYGLSWLIGATLMGCMYEFKPQAIIAFVVDYGIDFDTGLLSGKTRNIHGAII